MALVSKLPRRILPPRPGLVDFALSGACAGLILGIGEGLTTALLVGPLPPRLPLLIVFAPALLASGFAWMLGLGLQRFGKRPTHSALVAYLLGLLLLLSLAGVVLYASNPISILLILLIVAGATMVAARIAEWIQAAHLVLSGPLVWSGATLLLVLADIAARSLAFRALALFAFLLVFFLAGFAVAGVARLGRSSSRGPWAWSRLFFLLCSLGCAVALVPWYWPWLDFDPNRLPVLHSDQTPWVLVVDASTGLTAPEETLPPLTALLASEGVYYRWVIADRGLAGGGTLQRKKDSKPFAWELQDKGYVTAGFLTDPTRAALYVSWSPQVKRTWQAALVDPLRYTVLGAVLRPLLQHPQFDAYPAPAVLTPMLQRWLLVWRKQHAPAPYGLLVDYSRSQDNANLESIDGALSDLFQVLEDLNLMDPLAIVILLPGDPQHPESLRVVLRPSLDDPHAPRGAVVEQPVFAEDLAALPFAIVNGTQSDYPGLSAEEDSFKRPVDP